MHRTLKLGALPGLRREARCSFAVSYEACGLSTPWTGKVPTKSAELTPESPGCGAAFPGGRGHSYSIYSLGEVPQNREHRASGQCPCSLLSPPTWQDIERHFPLELKSLLPSPPPPFLTGTMHISLSQVFVTKLPIPPSL